MELFEPPDDLQFMLGESKALAPYGYEASRVASRKGMIWAGTLARTHTGRLKVQPLTGAGALLASSLLSRSLIRQAHRLKE